MVILHIMDGTSISTISPARAFINKGVNIGANIVEKAVMVTDIATFALATNAMTFDAKPLGDEPTKTKPAAIPTGNENAWAKAKPSKGMIVNWQHKPMIMPKGILNALEKSETLRVVPIANMIT